MVKILYDDLKTIYKKEVPVLLSHLNYGNHVGNDSFLTIIQEARIGWLKQNNMGELNIYNDIGFLVTGATVSYKAEAFHGDVLEVHLYIDNYSKKTFSMRYKVAHVHSGKVAAIAETEQIFYDFGTKKIASIPEDFVSVMHCLDSSS